MALPSESLMETLQNFIILTEKPELFLSVQDKLHSQFKDATKEIYDLSKSAEQGSKVKLDASLPELIVEDFDEEQIWQELELQNNSIVNSLTSRIPSLTTNRKGVSFCRRKAEKENLRKKPLKENISKLVEKRKTKKQNDENGENLIDEEGEGLEDIDDESDKSEDKSDDDDKLDSSGSDAELTKIKSRLISSIDVDEDDDLDFDFGNLGDEFPEVSDEDFSKDDGDENVNFEDIDNITDNTNPDLQETGQKANRNRSKGKKSVVDDKFFKLSDMAEFLDQEDAREERKQKRAGGGGDEDSTSEEEEEIDMFEAFPSDSDNEEDGGKTARYEDFFDPPDEEGITKVEPKQKKKVHFTEEIEEKEEEEEENDESDGQSDVEDEDSDDEEADDDNRSGGRNLLEDSDSEEGEDVEDVLGGRKSKDNKSSFEKRQEKLQQKISQMEDASLEEKAWQLKGEVMSSNRPENSLLEEHLMFDHTTKLAPVITQETTQELEDIIKQRIKDKAFDDVERKIKPKDDPFEYKKRIVLDQEKSKLSLGELYEQEYLKRQKEEEEEKTDPDHEEVKKMMQSLFIQLDALSNFHYTPKASAPEVKIVSNLPSIGMEEVAPVGVSDAKMLAPEEVQDKAKGELIGKTEKSTTDRKRERRKKKIEKKKKIAEKEKRRAILEQAHPEIVKKNSKEIALKGLKKQSKSGKGVTVLKEKKKKGSTLTSSKKFFTQLQEEVSTQIRSKTAQKRKHEKTDGKSAKKFKL